MSDTDQLEADIRETRQQLGETVEALSEKLDVKAHVKNSASRWVPIVAVAGVAVLATIIWRKRS